MTRTLHEHGFSKDKIAEIIDLALIWERIDRIEKDIDNLNAPATELYP